MIGAIIGDIVGSVYEFDNIKTKEFPLLTNKNFFTDDTVMTLAVAKSLMDAWDDKLGWNYLKIEKNAIQYMQQLGRLYPYAGYGGRFGQWIFSQDPKPYNSYGNGSAMRVSACGEVATSIKEAKLLSDLVTKVTHNHLEGLKGAEATTVCVFLAKQGKSKEEIKQYVDDHYYKMDFTLDEIRPKYKFNETCQRTVPQALECFFESTSFEDSLRNAISIGGDSDTIGAIMGPISEACHGVDDKLREATLTYLDDFLKSILIEWEMFLKKKKEKNGHDSSQTIGS